MHVHMPTLYTVIWQLLDKKYFLFSNFLFYLQNRVLVIVRMASLYCDIERPQNHVFDKLAKYYLSLSNPFNIFKNGMHHANMSMLSRTFM